jgi:hypothetical protein
MRYSTSHLPFPAKAYYEGWRSHFVPTLLAWAGSQEDPFGTNGQMDDEIVAIWTSVFPDLEAVNDETMPIIHSVVSDFSRICMA